MVIRTYVSTLQLLREVCRGGREVQTNAAEEAQESGFIPADAFTQS
ncbi:MAG: hypothetical protein K0U78_06900 [Actinomycetia bacterium]|nr:hypothetical protein [Actinomycetes bacterium]